MKAIRADSGEVGQIDLVEGSAPSKDKFSESLYGVGEGECSEGFTSLEGAIANGSEGGREGQRGERGAILEGKVADGCEGGGEKIELGEGGTIVERVVADVSERCGVAEGELGERGTKTKDEIADGCESGWEGELDEGTATKCPRRKNNKVVRKAEVRTRDLCVTHTALAPEVRYQPTLIQLCVKALLHRRKQCCTQLAVRRMQAHSRGSCKVGKALLLVELLGHEHEQLRRQRRQRARLVRLWDRHDPRSLVVTRQKLESVWLTQT